MKKILIVNTIGFAYEGITSVILNYLSFMNYKDMDIDFLIFPDTDERLLSTLDRLGTIVQIEDRKRQTFNYMFQLRKLLKDRRYDVVHINGNSGTMGIESVLSKIYGVETVIVHCHASKTEHPIINKLLIPLMKCTADKLFACSEDAGKWVYGKAKFKIINNAIDLNRFCYKENIRNQFRADFGFSDSDFVIGTVGRLSKEKNQVFLVEIIKKLMQDVGNVKLLIVGDGDGKADLDEKIEENKLQGSVVIQSRRSDPENMYQMMDVFVFPSRHEGLGLVAIEAQANGLPCIVSIGVPKAVDLTGKVLYLDYSIEEWCDYLRIMSKKKIDRKSESEQNIVSIKEHGYDIYSEAVKLEDIYTASGKCTV